MSIMPTPRPHPTGLRHVFSSSDIHTLTGQLSMATVIERLVARLRGPSFIQPTRKSDLVASVLRRETYGSSAVGKGLAFPHFRCNRAIEMVGVIGMVPRGCDFGSLDNRLTKCVFLTVSPVSWRREHGELLQRLFGFVRDQTLELLVEQQASSETIWNHLMAVELRSAVDEDTVNAGHIGSSYNAESER